MMKKGLGANRGITISTLLSPILILLAMVMVGWPFLNAQALAQPMINAEASFDWQMADTKVIPANQEVRYEVYPERNEIFGTLWIPVLKQSIPIVEGTGDEELKKGAGHYIDSALPGVEDNCVLSGHRGTVFKDLGVLEIGDQLIVETSAGVFTYVINRIRIVHQDDRTVIVPTVNATLTLTTCYPFNYIGNAPDRYIVIGNLMPTTFITTNTGAVTQNQIDIAVGVAKDGRTVTIQSDQTNEVSFPASGLDSLAKKGNSLTLITKNATLLFDAKALSSMGLQATEPDIKVTAETVIKETLTQEQQAIVGDQSIYALSVMSGGNLISNFNEGKVTVNLRYELKVGETAENLIVWELSDDGILTKINCIYDAYTKTVTFIVNHFCKYVVGYYRVADWDNPFIDIRSSDWYYGAVGYVSINGLMNGQTITTFAAKMAITRGMFVTILGRMKSVDIAKYQDQTAFWDVDNNQYYAPYTAWAYDEGIVSGVGSGKFEPDASITREQMATIMTNYMKYMGQGPVGEWAIQLTYGDLNQVSSWAGEGVMFMTMKSIMNGMGRDANGAPVFSPLSTSTRAQAATMLKRLAESN